MFFHLVMSVAQRKNSESPWGIQPQTFGFVLWFEVQFLVGEFFLCPTLVTRRKNILLNSLLSSKLPSLLFLSKINDILISYPFICSFIHITHSVTHSLTHSFIHSMVVHQVECLNVAIHFFFNPEIAQDFLKVMEKCPNRLKRKISSVANLKAR